MGLLNCVGFFPDDGIAAERNYTGEWRLRADTNSTNTICYTRVDNC